MRGPADPRKPRKLPLFLLALLVAWIPASVAHAYLDPASGSLLLQLILGGVAGLLLAVKLFWFRILRVLGLKSDEDDRPDA